MKNSFKLLNEITVFETPYFQILDRTYKLPDGREHHFYIQKEVDTCCILALTEEGKFIVTEEYRVGPDKTLLELPAGRFESFKQDPEEAIRKELLEETGYSGKLTKVGAIPTSPYSTRYIHYFYATNCQKISEQNLDSAEFIKVKLLDKSEMWKVLMKGDSPSCSCGVFIWEWMKKDGYLGDAM